MQFGSSDTPEHPGLEEAQKLDLERQRNVTDLVDEKGSSSRRLHEAQPARGRAGERAFLVPEEFALKLGLRQA